MPPDAGAIVSPYGLTSPLSGSTVDPIVAIVLSDPITPPLPHSLSVDETEYMITTSHNVVAAGAVKITAYNRGMDEHDLVIKGPGGIRGMIQPYLPGTSRTIVVHLKRGTYLFYCSMFAGTPQSHEALGMHTLVRAR